MAQITAAASAIDPAVAEEAADWMLRLQEGELNGDERAAFDAWRLLSPMHALAWVRAEQLLGWNAAAPPGVGRAALQRLRRRGRRQALRTLGLLLVAAPVGWIATRQMPEWTADHRTAAGERRHLALPDGSVVVLNTRTALDIAYDRHERRLRLLAGEILVTTHADGVSPPRPFRVETAQGIVRALGTRFSVRRFDEYTHVAVFEQAVEIASLHGGVRRLAAGEQAGFRADHIGDAHAVSTAAAAAAWENGYFVANRMRLDDLVRELGRYRGGVMRCHPAVAGMPVSGTFPVGNDDRALALLEKTLPLAIERHSRWWVTLEPR